MATSNTDQTTNASDVTSFTDLGKEMWNFLTGSNAAINYQFVDMHVEVPRTTGPDSARATWRLNGTLRITTDHNAARP